MRQDLAFKPPGSVLAGEKLENPSRLRAKLCLGLLLAGFAAVAIKLVTIQIFEHEDWVKYVDKQRKSAITIPSSRGGIYDRNGSPLATSLAREVLCVVPSRVKDSAKLAKALSPYAGMSASKIRDKIKKTSRYLIYLKRGLDVKTRQEIAALGLDGVEFRTESARRYPKGSLAANLIGFANIDNKGLEGLEYGFDSLLAGESGKQIVVRDNSRREMAALAQTVKEARDGDSIILTIDENIQYSAEKALDEIVGKYSPESATAVVIDPKTGQVLAMAGRPTFDPNRPSTFSAKRLRNRAVTDILEPGSVFKPIGAAIALERGVITPEDRVYCEDGAMRYYGHTFNDVHPLGEVTFAKVMAESSNIGMIKVLSVLEPDVLYSNIRNFGFGLPTGIDLPGEVGGIVHPPSRWSGLSMGSLSIGQEVSVTALQIATAFSAIANAGRMMRPYVVSEVIDQHGETVQENSPRFVRQVIRPQTARTLAALMEGAVEFGTGSAAKIKGYAVAGKTGTAQKPDLENGGYYRDRYVGVFAGFVPADDPVAAIAVVVDNPQNEHYGGKVAAPAFRQIAKSILNFKEIPPTRRPKPETPDETPEPRRERRSAKTPIIIAGEDGLFRMPDLEGATMRAITDSPLARLMQLEFHGSGVAYWQAPAPGKKIQKGQPCRIAFKRLDTK